MTDRYLLKLYVTGRSVRAESAITNLHRICENDLSGDYEVEIIDLLERPQLAEDEKILATPLLIKQLPPPLRRVIGDLSNREQVLLGLDLQASARRRLESEPAENQAGSPSEPTPTAVTDQHANARRSTETE